MHIVCRELHPTDYPVVKELINKSFGLYRYIQNQRVLKNCLNAYLQSCLVEAAFTRVAERNGTPIGIMGKGGSDYHLLPHIKPIAVLGYHSCCMNLKALFARCDLGDYKKDAPDLS